MFWWWIFFISIQKLFSFQKLDFKIIIIGIKGLPNAYKLLGRKVPHWAERGAHGCSMRLLENYSSDLQNVAGFILSI